MAWIEVHQSLMTHHKLYRASALLEASENEVVGSLVRLWCWALDNAPTGELQDMPPTMIARAAGWTGNPAAYVAALLEAGFIDRADNALVLHHWLDYAGRLIERRQANALRMRAKRAMHVQNTCAARAGATVPNRTSLFESGQVPFHSNKDEESDTAGDELDEFGFSRESQQGTWAAERRGRL